MLKIASQSKLKPGDVIKRAVSFFGPGGYGLKVKEQDECCAYFEGGGGDVRVTASASKKGSSVELESREWDYQARRFLTSIS